MDHLMLMLTSLRRNVIHNLINILNRWKNIGNFWLFLWSVNLNLNNRQYL